MEEKELTPDEFKYVDFASGGIEGFRNHIVPVSVIPKLLDGLKPYECYVSSFLFTKGIISYMRRNIVNGRPSVSGYDGPLYSYFLPIDIDSRESPEDARKAAIAALDILRNDFGYEDKGLLVYFSGRKGFHVMADSRAFNVRPGRMLNLFFSDVRARLAERMGEPGKFLDQKIKDSVRLWRVPNTVNKKSGLYKVQVSFDELERYDIRRIRRIAERRRPLTGTDVSGLLADYDFSPLPKARAFYLEALKRRDYEGCGRHGLSGFFRKAKRVKDMCPAKERIYNSRIEEGERNNCALILASFFRESGHDVKSAKSLVYGWNKRNNIGLSDSEIRRVVESAYRRKEPYFFGCSSVIKFCPYADKSECEFLK